ncbi:ABC-type multidrug transport system ATPase subunit [Halolamina salifodinae]|uniref:ABC-type multidrug transport system ATPase subunit n=1 Tax=Halolamina salifodinae TaxID=1202767 RepID=A0A8T4H125_9EURY|nr:ATP-binding cassette domain-containing protein [Halolamina salifodinae]MBP1987285.1 ABC-type multidrug transport system ATPase subunit [Halolamina salifodinae]
MIRAAGLRKTYGESVAVEGGEFEAAMGGIFGIVGPNGAGKTATLKMLSGLVEPTAGEATVDSLTEESDRGTMELLRKLLLSTAEQRTRRRSSTPPFAAHRHV